MKLETIPDEDETQDALVGTLSSQTSRTMSTTSSNLQLYGARHSSETPSQEGNKSSSPSISTVTSGSMAAHAVQASDFSNIPDEQASWSKLPPDFRHYLNFYLENITNYHYCLVNDGDDFFKTILPQIAMRSEPLLNALVGFSAYHVTLQNPKGKLQDFLQYYTKSVTLLLSSLKRNDTHNISTLLTILQLATIEVFPADHLHTGTFANQDIGVSRGLGKSYGPSESRFRNPNEDLYTSDYRTDSSGKNVSWLVRSI